MHPFVLKKLLGKSVKLQMWLNMSVFPIAVVTSRSLFLGTVPIGTISPFLVPIWSLFYQTGPYSAKIVVQSRNIILAMTHWQLMPSDWSTN